MKKTISATKPTTAKSTAAKTGLKPSTRYPVKSRALPFKAKVEEKKIEEEPEVVEIAEVDHFIPFSI